MVYSSPIKIKKETVEELSPFQQIMLGKRDINTSGDNVSNKNKKSNQKNNSNK